MAVYLHDGGFSFGDGKDGSPTYLLEEENIVLVTVNYRLGPFGFLSTGEIISFRFGVNLTIPKMRQTPHTQLLVSFRRQRSARKHGSKRPSASS